MIFNQSEHEIQVGTVEVKHGKSNFVLAITGSKSYKPSIVLTPYGHNVNLNTFILGPCQWGSIVVEPADGINEYDLNQTWRSKNNLLEYDAKLNLATWWRMNQTPDISNPFVMLDSSGNGVNSLGQSQNAQKPSAANDTPSTHIVDQSLNFQDTLGAGGHGNVTFFETAGYWAGLVGGEGPTVSGGITGPGNSMSMSFWFRPANWNNTNNGQIIFIAGDNVAAGKFRGVVMATDGSAFKGIRIGWNAGLPDSNSYAATNFANTYPGFNLNTWHHAVITRSDAAWSGADWVGGNPYKFYLDGAEYTDTTYAAVGGGGIKPNPVQDVSSPNARIGYNSTHGYSGDLTDLAIWNTELTSTQARALYDASVSGVEDAATIRMSGDYWWAVIERSTDVGDVIIQYQAIGASPLRVK